MEAKVYHERYCARQIAQQGRSPLTKDLGATVGIHTGNIERVTGVSSANALAYWRRAMDWFQEDLASPPQASMSKTYAATFIVVAILALGAAEFVYFAGDVVPQLIAAIDRPAQHTLLK